MITGKNIIRDMKMKIFKVCLVCIACLLSAVRACEDAPEKLTISVGSAEESSSSNIYIVEIPKEGEDAITVTVTGGGDLPCPEDCVCGTDIVAPAEDGDPSYVFTHSVGSQDGNKIEWVVDSSTSPGEYKFKLNEITQNYKSCTDGYTGGSESESNSQESDEVTIIALSFKFSSSCPSETEDGGSADFELEVSPDSLSPEYAWTFEVPSGAGNNPNVNFTPNDQKLTSVAVAHWFADPGSEDKPPLVKDQGITPYTLKATLSYLGVSVEVEHEWTVFLPNPLGETKSARIEGTPSYQKNPSTGKWEITGVGTLHRFAPAESDITIHVNSNSQWHAKTQAHEEHHVEQWSNIPPWKDYYDVAYFYSGHPTSPINGISPQDSELDLIYVIDTRINFLNRQVRQSIDLNELERQARVAAHLAEPTPGYYTN